MAIARYFAPNMPAELRFTSENSQLIDGNTLVFREVGGQVGTENAAGFDPLNEPGRVSVYLGEFSVETDQFAGRISGFREYQDGALLAEIDQLDVNAAFFFTAVSASSEFAASLLFDGFDDIYGSSEGDILSGYEAQDHLFGEDGDDLFVNDAEFDKRVLSTLTGRSGDTFDGGSGLDTVSYSRELDDYAFDFEEDLSALQVHEHDGNGERDVLIDIEFIEFGDGDTFTRIDVNSINGLARLSEKQVRELIEMYIAYFNRAPDSLGLNFWGTAYANGMALEEIASLFTFQEETLETYPPDVSVTEFVNIVFTNVLGRPPDEAGLAFWSNALEAEGIPRDQFILAVLRGARADLKAEEGQEFVDQQIADRAYLDNKVAIGGVFSILLGMSNTENAATVMSEFNGSSDSFDAAYDLSFDFVSNGSEFYFKPTIDEIYFFFSEIEYTDPEVASSEVAMTSSNEATTDASLAAQWQFV